MDVANLGHEDGSPSHNVVIDYFSPTCQMHKSNNEIAVNNVDFHPLPAILASTSCNIIIVYVTS